jgi:hypothetical protein
MQGMSIRGDKQIGASRGLFAAAVLGLVVIISATGCAENILMKRRNAHLARRDLVGLSRGEVMHCAGAPDSAYFNGPREYLTYIGKTPAEIEAEADAADLAEAEAEAAADGRELPPEYYEELEETEHKRPRDKEVCVATFVMRHDLVERLEYSSVAGRIVSKMERCYDVIDDCLTLM